jgi:hypothetical protein
MGKIISFDFDGTLDTEEGIKYATELMSRGYEIHITTQRPPTFYKDVFAVAKRIGIELDNIHFCGIQSKKYVLEDIDYVFHLDDDEDECDRTPRSVYFDYSYRLKCESML